VKAFANKLRARARGHRERTVFPSILHIEYGWTASGRTIEPVLKVDARNAACKRRGEALA